MRGPSGVMATVCSKWALGRRSLVSTVQPSSEGADVLGPQRDHRLDGQDEARFEPDVVLAERLADEVGDLRLLVHVLADAVADELLDDVDPLALDVLLHQAGDLRPVPAAAHGPDGQVERLAGDVEQLLDLGLDRADRPG